MANKLFSSLQKEKVKTGKWFFIPFSFLMHALLIFSLTIGPFLDANNQVPDFRIIDGIQFVSVPILPPVPQGRGGGGGRPGKPGGPKGDQPKPVEATLGSRFVAPIEAPETISEDNFWEMGDDSALDGNYVDGAPTAGEGGGGVPGAPWLNTQVVSDLKPVRIQRARLIRRVKPVYPPTALAARIQGVVVVEAVTNIYGKVVSVSLRKGIPLLNQAALDAVKKWIYEPYVVGGIPKPVVFTVTVTFRLQKQ